MADKPGDARDPVAVVRALFEAYEAKQWRQAAELVDEKALAHFQVILLALAQTWEMSPNFQQQADETLPPEVAAYFDSVRSRTLREHGNPLLYYFPGVATLAELQDLPPGELLARWMDGNDLKPESYDDNQPPVFRRAVIGVVPEGDELAHVVYRIHTDAGKMEATQEAEVMTVRHSAQRWRVLMNRDIGGLGQL